MGALDLNLAQLDNVSSYAMVIALLQTSDSRF